jgi:DNA topoisomerase-1
MTGQRRVPRPAPGLVYVTDTTPGITRVRRGAGFSYRLPTGRTLASAAHLARIRSLAIPPAWTDVWICPNPNGHLQATGRDARGRKQHRYHPRWTKVRDEAKYSRMLEFAAALPALRRQTATDLAARGLPRRKVLALVVRLLERTLIRVGNHEYARTNGSFGLTTMQDRHVQVAGGSIRFRFRGKSGKMHDVAVTDPRLARLIRNCQELPGSQLFQYEDESGEIVDIGSADVNDYLRSCMGEAFTAKDFRTWAGSVLAARALETLPDPASKTEADRNVVSAVDAVAGILGNTRSVCRKCYIHPAIVDAYLEGSLARSLRARRPRRTERDDRLDHVQAAVLALLQRRLKREAPRRAA